MEQQEMNNQGQDTNMPENEGSTGSNGPVVGIIVVIVVLIVGAFYFFTRISDFQNFEQELPLTPEETGEPGTSSSDDVSAIEGDLEEENFDDIDAELGDIEAEFGSY